MTNTSNFLIKDLKPGDIINYKVRSSNRIINFILGLQRKIDKGSAGHSAIVIDATGGEYTIMEMYFTGLRIRKERNILINANRQVLRVKNITTEDILKFEKYLKMYSILHKNDKYSYVGLVSASISTIVKRLFKRKIQLLPEEKKRFCSELVAELYHNFFGIKFTANDDIITPNDLARSEKTKIFKDFS